MNLDKHIDEEKYWQWKAYGRVLLLLAIGVYGVGLILLRAHHEKADSEGEEIEVSEDE